jgi:hypothetical protein
MTNFNVPTRNKRCPVLTKKNILLEGMKEVKNMVGR